MYPTSPFTPPGPVATRSLSTAWLLRMPQAQVKWAWTCLLEELGFSSPFPTPKVLEKPEDAMCPWMDDAGLFVICKLERLPPLAPCEAAGLRPGMRMREHSGLPCEAFGRGRHLEHTRWGQGLSWILMVSRKTRGGSTRTGVGVPGQNCDL